MESLDSSTIEVELFVPKGKKGTKSKLFSYVVCLINLLYSLQNSTLPNLAEPNVATYVGFGRSLSKSINIAAMLAMAPPLLWPVR